MFINQRVFVIDYPGGEHKDFQPIDLQLDFDLEKANYAQMCDIASHVKECVEKDLVIIFMPRDVYDDFMYEDSEKIPFAKSRTIQLWQQNNMDFGDQKYKYGYDMLHTLFAHKRSDEITIINLKS